MDGEGLTVGRALAKLVWLYSHHVETGFFGRCRACALFSESVHMGPKSVEFPAPPFPGESLCL